MKLIVGLGNPGSKYSQTRHNLGFMALDELLDKFEPVEKTFWQKNKNLKSEIKHIKFNIQYPISPSASLRASKIQNIILAKPTTFMNNSGYAVAAVANYYKIKPEDVIIIHDDLDLPFGKIRVRFGGGAGGHKGVESIMNVLGTDKFLRIRLGIGESKIRNLKLVIRNSDRVSDYVLSHFQSNERGKVKTLLKETVRTVKLILKHGIEKYMGKYNK